MTDGSQSDDGFGVMKYDQSYYTLKTTEIESVVSTTGMETSFSSFSSGYFGSTPTPAGQATPIGWDFLRTSGYIKFDPPLTGNKIELYGYTDGK